MKLPQKQCSTSRHAPDFYFVKYSSINHTKTPQKEVQLENELLKDVFRLTTLLKITIPFFDKKQLFEEAKYNEQLVLIKEKEKRQQLIIYAAATGFIMMLAFAIILSKRLQLTRKQKKTIEEQKALVEEQKEIVEEQKKT